VNPALHLVSAVHEGGTAEPESVYLTAREAAAIPKVDEKTLYRWAKDDPTLPALRIKGVVRFPRARFLKWLRDREQGRGAK
jgi:predicted DNA-binding transcriptional regulator AlpA